jgi:hypothetical protein
MVDEWNKEDGVLRVGDEVTVDGEICIIGNQQPTANMSSYWAVVKREVNGTMYTVVDEDGNSSDINQNRL